MKKMILFFLPLWMGLMAIGFADNFVLHNETSYPQKNEKSRIALQWASSAKEVDDANKALMDGEKLNASTLLNIKKQGEISVTIPKNAEYFRVLVWSKEDAAPDLVTNWVEVVADKTYTIDQDHLVPVVLMSGTGC